MCGGGGGGVMGCVCVGGRRSSSDDWIPGEDGHWTAQEQGQKQGRMEQVFYAGSQPWSHLSRPLPVQYHLPCPLPPPLLPSSCQHFIVTLVQLVPTPLPPKFHPPPPTPPPNSNPHPTSACPLLWLPSNP
jgi:hypothetical protein